MYEIPIWNIWYSVLRQTYACDMDYAVFLLLSIGSFGPYPFRLLQWNGAYDCPSVHEATLENVDQ